MISRIGDSLLGKAAKHAPQDSMDENDTFRFQNLKQWFARCSSYTKRTFLRNVMDVSGDPLFWFVLKTIFKTAYTKDIEHSSNENKVPFDILPTDDYDRSLDLTALKRMIDQDTEWFDGLIKENRLIVFVELMLLSGINIINDIGKYTDELLFKSDGHLLSLDELISKYTEEQNTIVTIYDEDMLKNRPLEFEKILTKSNLSNHMGKLTDVVYHDYVKKMEEWEKRLLAFEQKYKHLTTADPRVEEVSEIIPFSSLMSSKSIEDCLIDSDEMDPALILESVNEYVPPVHNITSQLKYTVVSTLEYKIAKRTIDLAIERHIKNFPPEEMNKSCEPEYSNSGKVDVVDNNMHLVNPPDDRRTKQAENKCVLKAVRTEMPKNTLTNGFDTEFISMVPHEFCEDAQNYKMFPRSTTVPKSTSITK